MKLKDKLKFVLPIFSIVLLTLSYSKFVEGYQFFEKITNIDPDDVRLMQELSSIDGRSRLNSVDKNMQVLNNLLKVLFDKFSVSETGKDGAVANGVDKIGEFRDIAITVKGDFWQQIYFLQQVNKSMREFVVIEKLDGNNVQALFTTRVYGRTN